MMTPRTAAEEYFIRRVYQAALKRLPDAEEMQSARVLMHETQPEICGVAARRAVAAHVTGENRADTVLREAAQPPQKGEADLFRCLYPHSASPDDEGAAGMWSCTYGTLRETEERASPPDHAVRLDLLMDVPFVRQDLLAETVQSLREQTSQAWKLWLCGQPEHPEVLPEQVQILPGGDRGAALTRVLADEGARWLACLEPGDRLAPEAVRRVTDALASAPDTTLLYTDEDEADGWGWRSAVRLKPGWSEDQLLGGDTVGQLAVFSCRKLGALTAGQERPLPEWLYALKLAVTEGEPAERIVHLPGVLFHHRHGARKAPFLNVCGDGAPPSVWRTIAEQHLATHRPAVTLTDAALRPDGQGARWPRVLYPLPEKLPDVGVVIPVRDHPGMLRTCLRGLLEETAYPALRVLIVDNGSVEAETLALLDEAQADARVSVLRMDCPFNWAMLNNRACAELDTDLFLLLNDDVEILHPDWLEEMVRQSLRPGVGIVGARLLYPDGTLQHGGVVLSEDGATHILRGASPGDGGYLGQIAWQRDLLAVTGACLLIRREAWQMAGGLDEAFRVSCNDIDLCLRVRAAGWRVVWTPHAVLTHLDGATRGRDVSPEKVWLHCCETARLAGRWQAVMAHDPAVSPALRVTDHELLLAAPPPAGLV